MPSSPQQLIDSIVATRTVLAPLDSRTLPFVYALLMHEVQGYPWHSRGETPSLEMFSAALQRDMFAQFLVAERSTLTPVGYVGGYKLDLRNGHCYLAIAIESNHRRSPIVADAAVAFMSFAFRHWPLRKIYIERPAFVGRSQSLGRFAKEEARLREYLFLDGTYHDVLVYSIDRSVIAVLRRKLRQADSGDELDGSAQEGRE